MSLYLKGYKSRLKNLQSKTGKGSADKVNACLRTGEKSDVLIVNKYVDRIKIFIDNCFESNCVPLEFDSEPYIGQNKNVTNDNNIVNSIESYNNVWPAIPDCNILMSGQVQKGQTIFPETLQHNKQDTGFPRTTKKGNFPSDGNIIYWKKK